MNDQQNSGNGPLSGLRVIDWTMWQFGPVSTMMLADLGADVIKIESLDGDHGRQFASVAGVANKLEGTSTYFESLNRNKRGIALDLKHPKGLEVMLNLVDKSDIFVENFRQGVAERLGLGYDDLKARKPDIIYASATGYGPKGDDSGKPAFALTGEARAGSLWWAGPGDGIPYNINGMADQIAGIMLSYAVLGAVVARERFGLSQRVDVSHLGSLMWLGGMRDGIALLSGKEFERQPRTRAGNILWNYYRCKDDKWLAFSMSQGDRFWPTFCKALDRDDLVTDDRYSTMPARHENREALIAILDSEFIRRTREEWEQRLDDAGDLIWERVQSILDLPDDPQVIKNDYLIDFDHSALGPTKWHQTPIAYSETPVSTQRLAPAHGEHTESLLIDLLDYNWDDIEELKVQGVIL